MAIRLAVKQAGTSAWIDMAEQMIQGGEQRTPEEKIRILIPLKGTQIFAKEKAEITLKTGSLRQRRLLLLWISLRVFPGKKALLTAECAVPARICTDWTTVLSPRLTAPLRTAADV